MSTNVTIAASSLGTVILRKRIWDLWIPHPWTRNMRIWPRGRVIYIYTIGEMIYALALTTCSDETCKRPS